MRCPYGHIVAEDNHPWACPNDHCHCGHALMIHSAVGDMNPTIHKVLIYWQDALRTAPPGAFDTDLPPLPDD